MKKIGQVFNEIPEFNENQLDKQVTKIIRFLNVIHPSLEDFNTFNEGVIELRPLKRDNNLKHYIRSYNAWHMSEKDKQKLKEFLAILNGKGYCLYYSSFTFDYEKEVSRADGKSYTKGKVNNENALFTTILAMDFDDMTFEEFNNEKRKLTDLGIETIDIFTGHGFQSIILLDHRVTDKDILKKFTELMISKGFKVDEALKDPARVLRMPYSFNCKAMDSKSKHYDRYDPEIIPTTDINWTEKRYHVVDVFEKINSLPDVIPQLSPLTDMEIKAIPTAPINTTAKKKEELEIKEVKAIKIESLKTVYNMLDCERLPEPVQKMLSGSQAGLRNKVVMFLVPFLKNSLGLSIQTIKQIMALWGERCSPQLDKDYVVSEVDRIYRYGFKGKFGSYTTELQKVYGYLEFTKYTRKNKITIPNSIFEDFDVISDGAVRIYLALKLSVEIDGINKFTQEDIEKNTGISRSTFFRNIKDLVAMGYVCKKRTNRRIEEQYIYYINPYFSTTEGFTMLENSTVDKMLRDLTNGEMKLYSYLCKMIGDSQSDCWASQKYLAKKIGKAGQNSISMMTDSLNEKKFIKKQTEEKNRVMESTYNLNY